MNKKGAEQVPWIMVVFIICLLLLVVLLVILALSGRPLGDLISIHKTTQEGGQESGILDMFGCDTSSGNQCKFGDVFECKDVDGKNKWVKIRDCEKGCEDGVCIN